MIRFKVFIPVVIITALISWIILWKIDGWVKTAIEDGVSLATGTKTDVSGLKLSFKNSSLEIKKLEIGSSTEEFKNAAELEEIRIDFQTLPLFEKRLVIDDFSVVGIQWGTKRKTSSKLPPPPKKKEKPSAFSKMMDESVGSLKKEFSETPIAKLTDFKIPENPDEILRTLDLESEKAFKQSLVLGENLISDWKPRVESLKDFSAIERQVAEAKALTANIPQDPQEVISRIQKIQEIVKVIESEKLRYKGELERAREDVSKVDAAVRAGIDAVQNDYQKAASLVSLDHFKLNNMSRLLFGPEWVDRAEKMIRLHHLVSQKMAALTAKDEDVIVMKRESGRDIVFKSPKRVPGFLLAKSDFSVKNLDQGQRGKINQLYELKLRDINSAPSLHPKPMTLDLKGTLAQSILHQAELRLMLDHIQPAYHDVLQLKVSKLKADSWPMGVPRFFPLKMGEGLANMEATIDFKKDSVSWKNNAVFSNVIWDFKEVPVTNIVMKTIRDVMMDVKDFDLTILFDWSNEKFNFDLHSNFDHKLATAIQSKLNAEVDRFKAKLKNEIEFKVATARKKAETTKERLMTEGLGSVEDLLKKVGGYQSEAKSQIQKLEDSGKNKVKDAIGGQLKKLGF